MNNCTFAGRVGGDAEVRKTRGDESVANFSLAVDRYKKDEGPLWIKVTLWGKKADSLSQYITKGKQITVAGSVDLQSYETRDGEKRTDIILNAQQLTFGGGGQSDADDSRAPENTKGKYGF